MGLEPTTFCMASRRSSQLSYIRAKAQYSRVDRTFRRRGSGPPRRRSPCQSSSPWARTRWVERM
jgi:hypothetical protein